MKSLKISLTLALFCTLLLSLMLNSCSKQETCKNNLPDGIVYDNVNDENVIIDGYDVVAFFTDHKPVKGLPEYQAVYQGTKYYFSSPENKQLFLANQEKYRPQYGGWCAVAAARNHIQVISVEYFEIMNDHLYLNHNAKAKRIWDENPSGIVTEGDKNWPCLLMNHGTPFKELSSMN